MRRSKSSIPRSSTRTRTALASVLPLAEEPALVTSPAAFEAVRDEILAVPAERLVGLNLDIEVWARVHDKVPVTQAMVERAITLNAELQHALGLRCTEPDPLAAPGDRRHVRAQAFTLFAHAYAEARRGAAYLRWYERDAHRIVPSLYPRRSRKPSGTSDSPDDITTELAKPEPMPTLVAEAAADAVVAS